MSGENAGARKNPNGKPKRLGGFELIRKLGQGGCGVVFLARQLSMDRTVALKVLPKRLAKNRGFVERFRREAKAAAKLNHPNIVHAIDVGEAEGYFYFAMEYVNGETVGALLARRGPLAEEQALRIARDIADALAHAHDAGVLHRDVKPENIIIAPDGRAKLTDLGLAREVEGHDAAVTKVGAAMGTPHYISPEQVRGETELDGRTDVYSLGATLYHMLTGAPPFAGGTSAEVMAFHLTQTPPSPQKDNPAVSHQTSRIVQKAMAKTRDSRHSTAGAMRDDIADQLANRAAKAQTHAENAVAEDLPPSTEERPNRRKWLALGAGGAAAAITLALTLFLVGRTPPERDLAEAEETPAPTMADDPEPREPERVEQPAEPPDERRETAERELTVEVRTMVRRGELAEALARLETFLEENPDSAERGNPLRTVIRDEAERRYRLATEQAAGDVRERDFAAARSRLEAVKGFGIPEYTRRAEEELARVARAEEQWENWTRIKAAARELAGAGRYDDARMRLEQAAALDLDGVGELISAEMTEIERAREAAFRQARAALEKQSQTFWSLLGQRKLDEARGVLAEAQAGASNPDLQQYLQADADALDHILAFWSSVEDGIGRRKGSFISIGGARGELTEVADGEVTVTMDGVAESRHIHQLTADQARAYARLADPPPPTVTAVFLLADATALIETDRERADALLAQAHRALADVPDEPSVQVYRAKLARHHRPDPTEDAWARIAELGEPASREQAQQLSERLDAFEAEYAGTEHLAARARQIATLRERIRRQMTARPAPGPVWRPLFEAGNLDDWDIPARHRDNWSTVGNRLEFRGPISGQPPESATISRTIDVGHHVVVRARFRSQAAMNVSVGAQRILRRRAHPNSPEAIDGRVWADAGARLCRECGGAGQTTGWRTVERIVGGEVVSHRERATVECESCGGAGKVVAMSEYWRRRWPRGVDPIPVLRTGEEYSVMLVGVQGMMAIRVYDDRVASLVRADPWRGVLWRTDGDRVDVVLRIEGGGQGDVDPDGGRLEELVTRAQFWDIEYRTLTEGEARDFILALIREKRWPDDMQNQVHETWRRRFP